MEYNMKDKIIFDINELRKLIKNNHPEINKSKRIDENLLLNINNGIILFGSNGKDGMQKFQGNLEYKFAIVSYLLNDSHSRYLYPKVLKLITQNLVNIREEKEYTFALFLFYIENFYIDKNHKQNMQYIKELLYNLKIDEEYELFATILELYLDILILKYDNSNLKNKGKIKENNNMMEEMLGVLLNKIDDIDKFEFIKSYLKMNLNKKLNK
jgi:hypothetical protein